MIKPISIIVILPQEEMQQSFFIPWVNKVFWNIKAILRYGYPDYEVLFIMSAPATTHSQVEYIKRFAQFFSIKIYTVEQTDKEAFRKTALSYAAHDTICLIESDSDLSPEKIRSLIHTHGKKGIDVTSLSNKDSALESFTLKQKIVIGSILGSLIWGLLINPILLIQVIIATLSFVYLLDVIFTLYLVIKTIQSSSEITFTPQELIDIPGEQLPMYSILCPLYKEAHILPQFLAGIAKIEWPKKKLDVMLLIEEDDTESQEALKNMELPAYVRTIIVPHSQPKTKPKACNYGLTYALGEYTVIFDAEDIPDPLQLKKAYRGFTKSHENVVCLQAKLNYYNTNQNLLTRFFTAEYSLWFDITLPGLQSLNTTIPLGGTSNHFKTDALKQLQAWDPFNVTEDADLGIRLFKHGYKTAIIDSVTLEEANSNVKNWIRQRSRWIKGYMQTYLVHTREVIPFLRERGIHAVLFHLIIGGKIGFIFINPLLWTLTLFYFFTHGIYSPFIDRLYSPAVLYIAITSLILGNYLYLFSYVMGCVKREQWSLIKYMYLLPIYWVMISIAGCMGFYQLLFKPHYWEKTIHGLHLKKKRPAFIIKIPQIFPFPKIPLRQRYGKLFLSEEPL